MGLFRTATEQYNDANIEELFYGMAAQELISGKVSTGLYAKAAAENGGDTGRTNAAYIRLRVGALHVEHAALREQAAEHAKRQVLIDRVTAKQAAADREAKRLDAHQYTEWPEWIARWAGYGVILALPNAVIGTVFDIDTGPYFIGMFVAFAIIKCLAAVKKYLWAMRKPRPPANKQTALTTRPKK